MDYFYIVLIYHFCSYIWCITYIITYLSYCVRTSIYEVDAVRCKKGKNYNYLIPVHCLETWDLCSKWKAKKSHYQTFHWESLFSTKNNQFPCMLCNLCLYLVTFMNMWVSADARSNSWVMQKSEPFLIFEDVILSSPLIQLHTY